MGWTTCRYSSFAEIDRNGHSFMPPASRKAEIDFMLSWSSKDDKGNVTATRRVLKSAMVGSVYYGAVLKQVPGEADRVFAAIYLTCGKSRWDGSIWGYKGMDESMLPYYFDCPASILSLLTPTDGERANEWRECCRKRLADKARMSKEAKERKTGKLKLFTPEGVVVSERRGSWVLNSDNYQTECQGRYAGVKYSKRHFDGYERALARFLLHHGTDKQRAEFAAKGWECPDSWKAAAA